MINIYIDSVGHVEIKLQPFDPDYYYWQRQFFPFHLAGA